MIRLEESIIIDVPATRVWSWLSDLPRHYREWHPAHLSCRYVRGERLETGSVLQIEEHLHGKPHSLTLCATAVIPNRLLQYAGRGFRGAFELESTNGGTSFTASLECGWRIPFIGRFIDAVARRALGNRLAALRRHMEEEGRNLKRLLQSDPRPGSTDVPTVMG